MTSIYGLTDPFTGELRYIGKANDPDKRLASHMRDCRRRDTPVYRWIRKNGCPGLVVLAKGCADWRCEEKRLIAEARFSGVRLLNVADGGDEPYCSKEVRAENARKVAKLRVSTPDKKRLYDLKRQLGLSLRQGHVSEETKKKMRQRPDLFGQFAKYL